MKEGRLRDLEMEASEDEWSTNDSSSTTEATSDDSSSESESESLLEVMGIVLGDPVPSGTSAKE